MYEIKRNQIKTAHENQEIINEVIGKIEKTNRKC